MIPDNRHRLGPALLILAVVLNFVVLSAIWFAPELTYRVPVDAIQAEEGAAYVSSVPVQIAGLFHVQGDWADGSRSTLKFYEDGMLLGPAHSSHELIRSGGEGAFSHWGDALWFSTSDGTDPRVNGRSYSVKATSNLPAKYVVGALTFFAVVCVLFFRKQISTCLNPANGSVGHVGRQARRTARYARAPIPRVERFYLQITDELAPRVKEYGNIAAVVATIAVIVVFWLLRISYWQTVEEIPFSDMGAFDIVAHRIAADWQFGWSGFWQTYSAPSLAAARALQIYFFGDGLLPWQIFQGILTFGSLMWMAYELRLVTTSRWLSILLVGLVAVSQSSIFWSLKLSREGFHEAMTYMTIASVLFGLRRDQWWAYLLSGIVLAINFLNRSNSVFLLPLIGASYFFYQYAAASVRERAFRDRFFSATKPALLFFVGVMVLWTPWIVRSVYIYGQPVFLTTQGPYSFLWELGKIKISLEDGTIVETSGNELQAEATARFDNDLEASRYAKKLVDAWIRENMFEIPSLFVDRLTNTVSSRTIYLTRVSRDVLYDDWFDYLLLDKGDLQVYTGVLGLLLLGLLYQKRLLIVAIAVLVPWLTAVMFLGYSRMLEPALPLILFGNASWLVIIFRSGMHAHRLLSINASPSR